MLYKFMDATLYEYSYDKLIEIAKKNYETITPKHEYEVMFFNFNKSQMTYENYLSLIEFVKSKPKKLSSYTLDIVYGKENITYRITIDGFEKIKEYMKMLSNRPNYLIIKILVMLFKDKKDSISLMKKIKDRENIIDIEDLNIRIRSSIEDILTDNEIENLTKLEESDNDKIMFRFKQRISCDVENDKSHFIKIDLTNVKMSNNIYNINKVKSRYELEVELHVEEKKIEYLKNLMKNVEEILKIIQKSNIIITKSEVSFVINEYERILSITKKSTNLYGRQPISLDMKSFLDVLPNRYAVTDKADGDRCFLIIIKGHIFLINTNLDVIKTNIQVKEFDNTILDGEYIKLKDKQLFMVFDCLFCNNTDIRTEKSLMNRLYKADEVIKKCFVSKKQKGSNFESIKKYLDSLELDLKDSEFLIRRKFFIPTLGKIDNEIYKNAMVIWEYKDNIPYILDGLIFQPLNQEYVIGKESILSDLKWKPPEKNSIDFFIRIEKNRKTKDQAVVFDNSLKIKNKPYKICNLFCGKKIGINEIPVSFNNFKAYIFVENNNIKTLNNEIIMDETVVEFYYNNDKMIDEEFRWIPIRVRYDKTESVIRYKKRYGNNIEIANKIWNSIQNPILIDDIKALSNDKTYIKHRKQVNEKIIEKKDDTYYQQRIEIAKPLRLFHNWIKNNLIQTYFTSKKKLSVLDIGCGQGGDISKIAQANISFLVGIDIDGGTLLSSVSGALSRYTKERKRNPNFPKMTFIQADAGKPFDIDSQERALGKMTLMNKKLITEIFGNTTFDRINCQFAIHYFLKDDETWNNFKNNISLSLNDEGYIIITTFDGKLVSELFEKNDNFELYYINDIGEKKLFYKIVKKYDKKKKGTGNAIDVFNSIISNENVFNTEYLVDYNFLIDDLKTIGFELIESDLFINQYNKNKEFITNTSNYEEDFRTKKYLQNIGKFYDLQNELDKASFEVMKLNRYYVFRKTNKIEQIESEKSPKKNKKMNGGFKSKKGYEYKEVLFKLFKYENIIPESEKYEEFIDNFGIKKINGIESINKRIKIDHDVSGKRKKIINGLKTFLLEKDCDGNYDKTIYGSGMKYIKVIKEDDKYFPIYKKEGNEKKWIFDINK
jgi:SAM-dependent methyltransferase